MEEIAFCRILSVVFTPEKTRSSRTLMVAGVSTDRGAEIEQE
jgi:hypothetical protein